MGKWSVISLLNIPKKLSEFITFMKKLSKRVALFKNNTSCTLSELFKSKHKIYRHLDSLNILKGQY